MACAGLVPSKTSRHEEICFGHGSSAHVIIGDVFPVCAITDFLKSNA
jgi:hypothetical protein